MRGISYLETGMKPLTERVLVKQNLENPVCKDWIFYSRKKEIFLKRKASVAVDDK